MASILQKNARQIIKWKQPNQKFGSFVTLIKSWLRDNDWLSGLKKKQLV